MIRPFSSAPLSGKGSTIGPIRIELDLAAPVVYAEMTSMDGASDPPVQADGPLSTGEFVHEFTTTFALPFGIKGSVRTREAIWVLPPDTIRFRHLSSPVRGLSELVVVEPLPAGRSVVTYRAAIAGLGPLRRAAFRLLVRPAIERIVRAHVENLVRTAGRPERCSTCRTG